MEATSMHKPDPDEQSTMDLDVQYVLPDVLHTVDLAIGSIGCGVTGKNSKWQVALALSTLELLEGSSSQEPTPAGQELADQKPDDDLAPYPSPNQPIEDLYDANWDAPPLLIPEVDLAYHDQPSTIDDEHSESSAETVGTYQDPELMGPDSEWCVIARGIGDCSLQEQSGAVL